MTKLNLIKLSFIILSIQICVIQSEDLNQKVEQFSNSLNLIFSQSNERLSDIASKISNISESSSSQNLSECLATIQQVLKSGNRQEWSSNLIYSNSFVQSDFVSNILSERYTSLGNFDQCLFKPSKDNPIAGQYCLVTLQTPQIDYLPNRNAWAPKTTTSNLSYTEELTQNWLNIRNRFLSAQGICAPALCNEEQLGDLIRNYFEDYLNGTELKVDYCQQKNSEDVVDFGYSIASYSIKIIVVLSLFTTLLYIISSFTSKLQFLKKDSYCSKTLQCFDLSHNVNCLFNFDTKPTSYQSDFRYLNGLRALLIAFVVWTHCFLFVNIAMLSPISLFSKFPSFYHRLHDDQASFLLNSSKKFYIHMALFCIISGFINTYTQLKNVGTVSSFPVYVLMRWIRMVPSILATICLTIVMQKAGSGPLFHEKLTDVHVAPCYYNWWTNLLLISNFWTIDKECGISLWYSSANFQLSLLLYPILRIYSVKKSYAVLGSLALAGLTFSSPMLAYMDWAGIPVFDQAVRYDVPVTDGRNSLRTLYMSPLFYLMPYFLGAFGAMYLLNSDKKKTSLINPFVGDAIAIILFVIGTWVILLPIPNESQNQGNEQKDILFMFASLFYYTLVMLSLLFAMILASKAEKSILKQLLSARIFQFLNQLSYGIYLINPVLIWYNVHQNRHIQELNTFYIGQIALLVYFESIILSIFLFIFFESPFRNLSRVLKNYFSFKNSQKIAEGN